MQIKSNGSEHIESFYVATYMINQKVTTQFMDNPTINGRVVLIGDTNVGKTSLIQQFLKGQFSQEQKSTIGAVFHTYSTDYEDKKVVMQIWDTAGQERYRALGPIYYRKSNAAIAVFDLTNRETLADLKEWIEAFREHSDDPYVIIAANKSDLTDKIQFTLEETIAWASQIGAEVVWTSACTGEGTEDIFVTVTKHLIESAIVQTESQESVDINIQSEDTNKSGCC